ncbi:MAG: AAA family ATPase [Candidatus Aminicenantes bacterium]|nr:AAA family ATPase [Candidatus Aminicenantes bacterium]
MKSLKINHFGPIEEVDVELGDITILIGPQATGKSLFLQFLNLVLDYRSIKETITSYGYTLKSQEDLLAHYLGRDLVKSWGPDSEILKNGKNVDIRKFVKSRPGSAEPNTFYMPAQRVLIMEEGWPRPFQSLTAYPYVVRDFSERLRRLMETGLGKGKALFPQEGRFKKDITDKLQSEIFRNTTLKLEKELKKRLVLEVKGDSQTTLPIQLWSAGQREFMPLLLGLSYLTPVSKVSSKAKIETVIIEEIEMGLHPNAILGVMLAVMELISRGYRVVISTHSLHVVEIIWAIDRIKNSTIALNNKIKTFVKRLFNIENLRGDVKKMAERCLDKKYKVFYFDPEQDTGLTISRDITSLDPSAEDVGISGWGGLSEFSSNIVDVVAGLQRD